MNSDNISELIQKGFRITLGATTSLVESLQDSQKRDENIGKLQLEWSQLSEELAEKGAVTEEEARRFVDTLLNNQSTSTPAENSGATNPTTPTASPEITNELQELTAQIAAMRAELERLRNSNSSSQ